MARVPRFASIGAVLAVGAPAGWLLLQAVLGLQGSLWAELTGHLPLYGYLLLATAVAFAVFGAWTGHLMDRLAEANAQLEIQSLTDPLTRLRNRRYFWQRLEAEIAAGEREGKPLSLIAVDLDRFKDINDRFGHPVGDLALEHAASLLREGVRKNDVACRTGGEEFAILCPGTDLAEAAQLAERLRVALESRPLPGQAQPVSLTASFGVAQRLPTANAAALMRAADEALYAAKRAGRNQVSTGATTAASWAG
jgi:diguanylate cyclase (GGDEF)-like protein